MANIEDLVTCLQGASNLEDLFAGRRSLVRPTGDGCGLEHVDDEGNVTGSWLTDPEVVFAPRRALGATSVLETSSLPNAFGTVYEEINLNALQINNPSNCYNMLVDITHAARLRIDRFYDPDGTLPLVSVTNDVQLVQDITIDGGATWTSTMLIQDVFSNSAIGIGTMTAASLPATVLAGASLTIGYRYRVIYNGAGTPDFTTIWRRFLSNTGGISAIAYSIEA